MKEIIKNFLKKHNLLNPENIYLVAFSGGYDSLCLLDNMHKLSKEYGFKVVAGHLNHNWRGKESIAEENNAKLYCSTRDILFYSKTLPENLPHTELEAREQRYNFLNELSQEIKATALFTGHSYTDQSETVLYRILKGTGTIGLKGIPEKRIQTNYPPIYRPILSITRNETIEYCKINKLIPNIDSSNLNEHYLRNRIRLNLVPELKTYNSNIEESLVKLSKIAQDSECIIEEYLQQIKTDIYNKEQILTTAFLEKSLPVQKRLIVDFLNENKINHEYEKISEIIGFIQNSSTLKSGNTLSITTNCWLFASSQKIKLIHSIKADVIKSSISLDISENKVYHPELSKTLAITPFEGEKPSEFPLDTSNTAFVNLENIEEKLFLRTRNAGDKIQPFGMKEKIKLKKYLINKGIPEHERDKLPILATETEVLWVVGVGISELLRVKNTPTHILQVN